MSFGELLVAVETKLERTLDPTEVELIVRMMQTAEDVGVDDIVAVLSEKIRMPTDDEIETYRYEAQGEGVIPIPDAVEDPA